MTDHNLIPRAIREEFIRLLQAGKGSEAKRQDARKRVFSRMVGRMGAPWWNKHREELKNELGEMEKEALPLNEKSVQGTLAQDQEKN